MSLLEKLFSSKDDTTSTRVRQSNEDRAKITADRYTETEKGKHIHESYNLDTTTGKYKEYSGGDNSPDRSYNKR